MGIQNQNIQVQKGAMERSQLGLQNLSQNDLVKYKKPGIAQKAKAAEKVENIPSP